MVGSMQTPIIPIGSGQTQELIAPVQDTLIAKQNYAEGQQFILGGALFTVTKSGGISVGDTINMNTDVEASDNITDQINTVKNQTQYATASGTTFAQLWTFINSLNNQQKDSLVLTVNSPNRGNGILRRTLQAAYEGFTTGTSSISVMLLNTNNYYYRRYTFDGSAPSTAIESITSWSASYVK